MFRCDDGHDVTSFIDKIITYKKPKNDLGLELLVSRQIHRHCQTCRKKSKAGCRFNFPQPPMTSTTILYLLGDDVCETEVRKQRYLKNSMAWKKVKTSHLTIAD